MTQEGRGLSLVEERLEGGQIAFLHDDDHLVQPGAERFFDDQQDRGLGDAVTLYVDGGQAGGGEGVVSTIVDATGTPCILRHGAISEAEIERVLVVPR